MDPCDDISKSSNFHLWIREKDKQEIKDEKSSNRHRDRELNPE